MKYQPIIHNLRPEDRGYAEAQLYNNLAANRPTSGGTLASKIEKLRAWDRLCTQALQQAKDAIQ